jgi:hypothetical protein
MAIVARFSFDVPFGKKGGSLQALGDVAWFAEELGFPRPEVLIGSPESRVEYNHRFENLAGRFCASSPCRDFGFGGVELDLDSGRGL